MKPKPYTGICPVCGTRWESYQDSKIYCEDYCRITSSYIRKHAMLVDSCIIRDSRGRTTESFKQLIDKRIETAKGFANET